MPRVSVIILNYNGRPWLEKCIDSLARQSIADQVEVILADNLSTDGSDQLAEKLAATLPHGHGRFMQNGANLGFCEGNNRPALLATGEYLFFLNNDAWLEPDCLQKLLAASETTGAAAAAPLILNYDTNEFQSFGAEGFDIFGLPSARLETRAPGPVLMPEGCAYWIRADVFREIGAFDPEFFMYSDEYDLSWRLWIAGYSALRIPEARVHHRGAANVNPAGGGTVVENRTSDTKRFYANRNALLVLLKNARNFLLLTVLLQLFLLAAEALVSLVLVRRWSFIQRAYLDALSDCFRLASHIRAERARIRRFRKRGDLAMLRFLTWRLNRWDELKRILTFGLPKVAAK